MTPSLRAKTEHHERVLIGVLFAILLVFHFWASTVGWTTPDLPGIEFRQTQTAISAYFIKAEHNYSLSYPTPVLGKPWSVPMEFPLYQWLVAWLSERTGQPLTEMGRAVSLGCFYLTLPALYLLLDLTGLPARRRLLVLGLMLTSPLYIFYSRAFLIETMALMFAVWFAAGYIRIVAQPGRGWLLPTLLAGVAGSLVKVTTLLFILIPLLVWTLGWLGRSWRQGKEDRRHDFIRGALTALIAVAVPALAAVWWIRYADAVKALNPDGGFLVSENLTSFNFGTSQHWDPAIWAAHWRIICSELMPAGLLALSALLALVIRPRNRGAVLLLLFAFGAVQMVFPTLYAYHDYYYVANGMTLLLAVGLVLDGLLEGRLPRVLAWLIIFAVQAVQVNGYLQGHYQQLRFWQPGGNPLTFALRQMTNPEDVLIIAGDDWNSMTPYYAQRRALMMPNGTEADIGRRQRTFAALRGEAVTALILKGEQRKNLQLLTDAGTVFGIDPRPVFTWQDVTVYLHRRHRIASIPEAARLPHDLKVQLTPESLAERDNRLGREVELTEFLHQQLPAFCVRFAAMHPMPWKYYTRFGMELFKEDGHELLGAHPDTRLWYHIPAGARSVEVECYLSPAAYAEALSDGDASDGVEFLIATMQADGSFLPLATRFLDPRRRPGDRGIQILRYDGVLTQGTDVVVLTRPGPRANYTRDWAGLGRITIQ